MLLQQTQKILSRLDSVNDKLDAVRVLFDVHPEAVAADVFKVNGIAVDTLFDSDNFTVTRAIYNDPTKALPIHAHENVVEYLIITRGRFILKLDEHVRMMNTGDCASIPPGAKHTTIATTPESEVIGVCIPPEIAYRKAGS